MNGGRVIFTANRHQPIFAHYHAGKSLGLTHDEMQLARKAKATKSNADAMMRLTRAVVLQRGQISDDDFRGERQAACTNAQIIEIVRNIALNILSNYFNSVAQTEVLFPLLQPRTKLPRSRGKPALPDGRVATPAAGRSSLPKPPSLLNHGKLKRNVAQ